MIDDVKVVVVPPRAAETRLKKLEAQTEESTARLARMERIINFWLSPEGQSRYVREQGGKAMHAAWLEALSQHGFSVKEASLRWHAFSDEERERFEQMAGHFLKSFVGSFLE